MPAQPTTAQQVASRANGRQATGPRHTAVTRFNARVHGFTAAVRPPEGRDDRRLYDRLLITFTEEFLPCGNAEFLVLEQIVVLELRRIRIQETLMAAFDFDDEAGLKRLALLSRYETDTLNKLDKHRKLLADMQNTRARRRSLTVEASLIRREAKAIRHAERGQAIALAERAISRELLDLGMADDQARDHAATLIPSGSFRNTDPAPPELLPTPTPATLPGPPWDPWRGVSHDRLATWNDELIRDRRESLLNQLRDLDAQAPAPTSPPNPTIP